ncbi:MAG TPA: SH3 domain-containing protein [Oceanobacillus sp.]|nr:SH3 domain-containing protein [Oceanobacillus sp.]
MAKRHYALMLAVLMALMGGTFIVLGQSGLGVGWTAQYFNNTSLSGSPVYTETLPNGINFNWGTGSPNALVPVDNWSARFTSVQTLQAGTYEFVVASDDGVRVFIDNVLVLDRFVGRILTTDRFQQNLTAGPHSITVEYVEFVDQAALQFQWFLLAGGTETQVAGGGGGFATPFGTPPPTAVYTGPTVTVVGVRGLAVRTGPYLGASYITALVGQQSYPVLARNRDEGVYTWYLVQVGERQGWSSGRYLTVSVDPETLPIQGSVFDEHANPPDLGVVAIPRAVMNLRARPSIRSPRIGSIPWGAQTSLVGRTVQGGIDRWYQVRYNGQVGWIAAPWVTVRGDLFRVPVR